MLDYVKHRGKIDSTLRNSGRVFDALANHPTVTLASQSVHHMLVQLKSVKTASRHSQLLDNLQKPAVPAPNVEESLWPLRARTKDLGHLSLIEKGLRFLRNRIYSGIVICVICRRIHY